MVAVVFNGFGMRKIIINHTKNNKRLRRSHFDIVSSLTALRYLSIQYGYGGSHGYEANRPVTSKDLENTRRYAKAHLTTLSQLVTAYLQRIPTKMRSLEKALIVRQLTGVLSDEMAGGDYKKHLEDKYGKR